MQATGRRCLVALLSRTRALSVGKHHAQIRCTTEAWPDRNQKISRIQRQLQAPVLHGLGQAQWLAQPTNHALAACGGCGWTASETKQLSKQVQQLAYS